MAFVFSRQGTGGGLRALSRGLAPPRRRAVVLGFPETRAQARRQVSDIGVALKTPDDVAVALLAGTLPKPSFAAILQIYQSDIDALLAGVSRG